MDELQQVLEKLGAKDLMPPWGFGGWWVTRCAQKTSYKTRFCFSTPLIGVQKTQLPIQTNRGFISDVSLV